MYIFESKSPGPRRGDNPDDADKRPQLDLEAACSTQTGELRRKSVHQTSASAGTVENAVPLKRCDGGNRDGDFIDDLFSLSSCRASFDFNIGPFGSESWTFKCLMPCFLVFYVIVRQVMDAILRLYEGGNLKWNLAYIIPVCLLWGAAALIFFNRYVYNNRKIITIFLFIGATVFYVISIGLTKFICADHLCTQYKFTVDLSASAYFMTVPMICALCGVHWTVQIGCPVVFWTALTCYEFIETSTVNTSFIFFVGLALVLYSINNPEWKPLSEEIGPEIGSRWKPTINLLLYGFRNPDIEERYLKYKFEKMQPAMLRTMLLLAVGTTVYAWFSKLFNHVVHADESSRSTVLRLGMFSLVSKACQYVVFSYGRHGTYVLRHRLSSCLCMLGNVALMLYYLNAESVWTCGPYQCKGIYVILCLMMSNVLIDCCNLTMWLGTAVITVCLFSCYALITLPLIRGIVWVLTLVACGSLLSIAICIVNFRMRIMWASNESVTVNESDVKQAKKRFFDCFSCESLCSWRRRQYEYMISRARMTEHWWPLAVCAHFLIIFINNLYRKTTELGNFFIIGA